MDHGGGNAAGDNYNPRETANIFSIVTFFYNYKILRKGRQKDLEEKDVYRVMPDYEAGKLGDKLESQWNRDGKRKKGTASIARCLIKCFGLTYFFYGLVQLVFTTSVVWLSPRVFSKFVSYFQGGQTTLTTKDACLYALAVIGLNLLSTLYINNFQQLIIEYAIKVRTAVCSLIYRKALRISSVAFSDISIGKIVTLMSKDVFSIDSALSLMNDMTIGFLQLGFVTFLLYQKVGISAFPAVGVIMVIIPIQLFVGRKTTEFRIKTAKKTDERLKLLQETLSAIKIIKMYTWQSYFEKLIHKARLKETDKIKIVYYLKAFIVAFGGSTINLAFYILLISYIARGHPIDAETVYFVQNCLMGLRLAVGLAIPFGIAQTSDMIAALKRIQLFLDAEEVIQDKLTQYPADNPTVYLTKVTVSIKGKEILKSASLNINRGLLLVSGNVGSGKSALLKTILGEYPVSSGSTIIEGTLSYAPEDPWLFPSTIRQNILFGEPYNEKRYQEVLNVCALTYDINKFEKFDLTIVGDKGINLSKGQQARIALARAVYKKSDIYLLDDCLSSLDNHVNQHIFNECIKGFLKDKICILVTNNINNIKTVSNSNVLFIEDGRTLTLEQQRDALDKRITYYIDEDLDWRFSKLSRLSRIEDEDGFAETDALLESNAGAQEIGNLYHENNKEGKVLWSNYMRYYKFVGGFFVVIYLCVVFAGAQFCLSYSQKLISLWVNLEPNITRLTITNQMDTDEYREALKSREQFLNIYTILTVGGIILALLRSYSSFFFCMNGARKLHRAMVNAMLHAYMYFFDDHFIGNIINRLSKDFHSIDEYIPFLVFECTRLMFNIVAVFLLVTSVNWVFIIPGAILMVFLYLVRRFYQPTGRSLKRLDASTRSPLIGYLNATLEGLPIVRAAHQQHKLQSEFDRHQDLFTSTSYMNMSAMRFFSFLLELFGQIFLAAIIVRFILSPAGATAGGVGLAISEAMLLSGILQQAFKQITEVENLMTAVERVLEYSDVAKESTSGQILADWPTKASIRYNNVSLTYKTDGNAVLKNISFQIEGGSKIGVVGRTGAGKSSIISTLFRLYDYDGQIFIDNENIATLSLDFLRSTIGIIPQDPVLFSGSVRTNIDPFQKHSDADIWKVLEKVYMKSHVTNLNQPIDDIATSYSSGQKQLICLARALVQEHKIIVLDEATANLDPETDQLLQKTVKECFAGCTVITIAHRLHSVLSCDKVLVLDAGRIVEFDEPGALLENADGALFKMVQAENSPFDK